MKAMLNVQERYAVINTLPIKGNFANMHAVQSTRKKLELTPEEKERYRVVEDFSTGRVVWDLSLGVEEKEFEINDVVAMLLRQELKRLDESNGITPVTLSLFEKFVMEKPKEAVQNASN